MVDRDNSKSKHSLIFFEEPRGFGFVTFKYESAVDDVFRID